MPRQPVSGGKKKNPGGYQAAGERALINAYARKVAGNSRDATSKKRVADAGFKKFGDYLAATDINGRGRAIESARRKKQLDSYVKATGAAGVASGYGTVGKKKTTSNAAKNRAATAEVRAAKNARKKKPTAGKKIPDTM